MRHHAFDALVVEVGGGGGIGQQQRGVEDVQPLVFHGPEVEVAHGDDHEQVQVVLAAEHRLVPGHGALEAVHGVGGPRRHAGVDEDAQGHRAAGHGDEAVLQHIQLPGHQGEQVAGLGERVVPDREAPAARQLAGLDQIAVGEQMLERLVALHPHGEARQHVRPVGEPGDLAEPLGLALGAEAAGGHVEAFERLVAVGVDLDLGLQTKGVRHARHGQPFVVDGVLARVQGPPVQGHGNRLQPLTVQPQRPLMVAVAPDRHLRLHARGAGLKIEVQMDLVDQEVRRGVVGEADRLGGVGAHPMAFSVGRPPAPPAAREFGSPREA